MARAPRAAAPGAAGAGGVRLLELFGWICVIENEVGGLLKKGGLSGQVSGRPPLFLPQKAQEKFSHKKAHNAQNVFLIGRRPIGPFGSSLSLWFSCYVPFVPFCGLIFFVADG